MRGRGWVGLYHFEAKAFLMRGGDGRALTAAASALWALAAAQKVALAS